MPLTNLYYPVLCHSISRNRILLTSRIYLSFYTFPSFIICRVPYKELILLHISLLIAIDDHPPAPQFQPFDACKYWLHPGIISYNQLGYTCHTTIPITTVNQPRNPTLLTTLMIFLQNIMVTMNIHIQC